MPVNVLMPQMGESITEGTIVRWFKGEGDEVLKDEPLSIMRRKIAEHMVLSRRTLSHVHTVFEADISCVVALRARQAAAFEARAFEIG